jgi:DNA-binding response OmpR family regulator
MNERAMKLLVVDDERHFLETLVKRLGRRGFSVRGADSGERALEEMSASPADVVVLDVKMPGVSGLETLRRIKADYPLTEVVMLTAHADMEAAAEGLEFGAFDYLMKPMDIDELVYKIEDAWRRRSLRGLKIQQMRSRARNSPDET